MKMAVRTHQEICVQVDHCAACFGARMRAEPVNRRYHRRKDKVFAAGRQPCGAPARVN